MRHGFLLYLASSAYEGQPAMINQSAEPKGAVTANLTANRQATQRVGKKAQLGFYFSCTQGLWCSRFLLASSDSQASPAGHSFLWRAHLTSDAGQHEALRA
jgi:hypothetical protein